MNKEERCKNCAYWSEWDAGVCENTDDDDHSAHVDFGADDDSGLWASMVTGPEFGCVQFSAKIHQTKREEQT